MYGGGNGHQSNHSQFTLCLFALMLEMKYKNIYDYAARFKMVLARFRAKITRGNAYNTKAHTK